MKLIWDLLPSTVKAFFSVMLFFISLGWASYGAVILIVKAEGQDIEKKVMLVRKIDIEHIDKRFDQVIQEIRQSKRD